MEGDHVATPANLPSLISNSSSSISNQFVNGDEVSLSSSESYYIFSEFGRLLSQRLGDCQSGQPSGEEDSVPMDHSSLPQIRYAPSFSLDASVHHGLSSLHPHESRISSGFFDSPTHVASSGESSSGDSLSYFSPGPFPGGYSTSSPSNPFIQASQEEVRAQEEERASALALALEEGLQGLSEGVRSRGSGGGSFGAARSFSEGEAHFRAL